MKIALLIMNLLLNLSQAVLNLVIIVHILKKWKKNKKSR